MSSLPPDREPFASASAPLGLDVLPPELEGIQRDLFADAAQWERGVPSAARFNQRLRAVLPVDESAAATNQASSGTRIRAPREATSTPQPQRARPRARPTPLSTALALVAAVAVVALLAAVVATLRPGGAATKTTMRVGTPTLPAPITTLPLRATIAQQPGIPVVVASNPSVIYEYRDGASTSALPYSPVLRRSDDGGASWHALAYPTAPSARVSSLTLAVNPTDAANVFLNVVLDFPPGASGACRQANPGEKSVICASEYVSTDSGAHWSPMHYPLPGTLFPTSMPNSMALDYDPGIVQAQGDRLYATLLYHNTQAQPATEIRILSSTDHGATFHVADAALATAGLHICDFVAAPAGATLFARTAAVCQGEGFTSRQLWRSDDAGAHWRQVTPFAAPFDTIDNSFTVASAPAAGGSQMIIYDGTFDQQTNEVHYYASLDGGASWQPAPTAGLPASAQGVWLPARLGDGSLVVAYTTDSSHAGSPPSAASPTPTITPTPDTQQAPVSSTGIPSPSAASTSSPTPAPSPTPDGPQVVGRSITCYAWKPGLARWVPLTQPVAIGTLMPMNLFTTDGAQRAVVLTLVDSAVPGMGYTIERFG